MISIVWKVLEEKWAKTNTHLILSKDIDLFIVGEISPVLFLFRYTEKPLLEQPNSFATWKQKNKIKSQFQSKKK